MKEEKENLILKFLGFFIGPIQFVMEAAAVLAAGLQDWVDFGVICALLILKYVLPTQCRTLLGAALQC
jgi:H+-transporting ATPase